MKYLSIFLLLFLGSCSASWHIQRAERLDPGIFKPTVKIEYEPVYIPIDTIFTVDFSDFLDIDTTPNIIYETEYIDKVVKIYASFDTIYEAQKGLKVRFWMNRNQFGSKFEIDSSYIFHLQDSIQVLNKVITNTNTAIIENKIGFKQYFIAGVGLVFLFLFTLILLAIFKK